MTKNADLTPAALYARVSNDRQDVDLSVATQLRALRDYAERNGYSVAREYVDEAESGKVADRPQFRRMLDEAANPEAPFKEILVWKFSRFTRKREHAVAFKSMLRRKGVRVVSITEHADDSPTGKLMEAIIESVDEFYSENLAEEVRRGMREAASRGFWVASRVPYGYRKLMVQDGAKERPTLEADPATSPVVQRIFDMAESGRGILDITRVLNGEGIANPTGRPWSKNGVHIILRNEAYTGTLALGRRRQGQGRAGAGGEGVPRHRLQDPVPQGQPADEIPRPQEGPSPPSGKLLSPQRSGQVPRLPPGHVGPGLQGREVRLLRLPVTDEAGQRGLRLSQAERPPVRGDGDAEDSGERAHRVQHQGAGQAGGRGDGRGSQRTSASGWRPPRRSWPT